MLLKGGNAVDAAIAAAAAITIVEPVSCGLGSDAFAILWDGKQLHGLNSSGVAPAAWNGYFQNKYGTEADGTAKRPIRGWDAVTVPGVIAGWAALHERFGKLPFADLLEPAIEIAERGYAVPPMVAHKWNGGAGTEGPARLCRDLHAARPRATWAKFVMKAAADTLRKIGETGAAPTTKARSPRRSPPSANSAAAP